MIQSSLMSGVGFFPPDFVSSDRFPNPHLSCNVKGDKVYVFSKEITHPIFLADPRSRYQVEGHGHLSSRPSSSYGRGVPSPFTIITPAYYYHAENNIQNNTKSVMFGSMGVECFAN